VEDKSLQKGKRDRKKNRPGGLPWLKNSPVGRDYDRMVGLAGSKRRRLKVRKSNKATRG